MLGDVLLFLGLIFKILQRKRVVERNLARSWCILMMGMRKVVVLDSEFQSVFENLYVHKTEMD